MSEPRATWTVARNRLRPWRATAWDRGAQPLETVPRNRVRPWRATALVTYRYPVIRRQIHAATKMRLASATIAAPGGSDQ